MQKTVVPDAQEGRRCWSLGAGCEEADLVRELHGWAGSLWAFPPHASSCSSPGIQRAPCMTIIPESSSSGQHAYEAAAKAGPNQGFLMMETQLLDSADTQCGPTLLPALSGHQGRKNNQSQALLSTGLWLLTKMEKTQWISMPHKHHWDGQCRCSLDGGSTFRGCGAGGCVTIWQMVSPDRPTALEKTEKGAMPWGSCPEKLRPISYGSACGITLILFFTYLASSLENPMRTFMKTHT